MRSESCAAKNKKGHVHAKIGRKRQEFFLRKLEVPEKIQPFQNGCSIRRSATQTGRKWNVFFDKDGNEFFNFVSFADQLESQKSEIFLRRKGGLVRVDRRF